MSATAKPSDPGFHVARLGEATWLAFCDASCLQHWLDAAPGRGLANTALSSNGPNWCMHCATCGKRCWRGSSCKLCPDCDEHWWLASEQGAEFAAELGRHGIEHLPPDAYTRGERLCRTGLAPVWVARIVVGTDRR